MVVFQIQETVEFICTSTDPFNPNRIKIVHVF